MKKVIVHKSEIETLHTLNTTRTFHTYHICYVLVENSALKVFKHGFLTSGILF